MDGAEVHGLSMGKKSPPKIGRDLREGEYLQAFISVRTKVEGEVEEFFKSLRLNPFL